MSERKVLNKYYPPDFDPNKIPKLKRPKNRQFNIRIMAPFNMRCGTCGEYIYKGKKFNSRQERVENEDYLGLMIFRFYIKCPRCVSEISFKTDPKNTDYELEAGATRNFEALRTAEKLAEQEIKEKENEEKNNPMKVLENRTKSSRQEMEMIETLEELRELNSRHAKVDHTQMIALHAAYEEQLSKLQDEEDKEFIRSVFGSSSGGDSVKRIQDFDEEEDDLSSAPSTPKVARLGKPSDLLTADTRVTSDPVQKSEDMTAPSTTRPQPRGTAVWEKSVGGISTKKSLLRLVKKKQPATGNFGSSSTATTVQTPTVALTPTATAPSPTVTAQSPSASVEDETKESKPLEVKTLGAQAINSIEPDGNKNSDKKVTVNSGLGLLGAYSDTDSSEDT